MGCTGRTEPRGAEAAGCTRDTCRLSGAVRAVRGLRGRAHVPPPSPPYHPPPPPSPPVRARGAGADGSCSCRGGRGAAAGRGAARSSAGASVPPRAPPSLRAAAAAPPQRKCRAAAAPVPVAAEERGAGRGFPAGSVRAAAFFVFLPPKALKTERGKGGRGGNNNK